MTESEFFDYRSLDSTVVKQIHRITFGKDGVAYYERILDKTEAETEDLTYFVVNSLEKTYIMEGCCQASIGKYIENSLILSESYNNHLFLKEGAIMSIKIKDAVTDDVEIISKIHALSWKEAYKGIIPQEYLDELKEDFWVDAFQNWISKNIFTVQLLYENETPVGCIAYGKARDEEFSDWGEIISIYILPDYWRKGYGQKLLETALIDMKNVGYRNCYLWVLRENYSAREFYGKYGFYCNDDEYKFEINNKPLTDIRYVLKF